MLTAFFNWLESRTDPFPAERPEKPPTTLFGFILHYARPFWPLLLVGSALAAIVAILEVYLFAFIGSLVDWLTASQPETFWQIHKFNLIAMSVLVLVVLPVLKFVYEAIIHQGLLGNFAMRTRWQAHRYLLRQSMAFFQDDFAGRLAAKMMQTALGVRETVMKITEVFLYVVVYFTAALVLFASSDLRLSAPMAMWLVGYLFALRYFVPRLRKLSVKQADARSVVTGRVVDSYTNISTVKMFADADFEDSYARESMDVFLDNVHRQMRLVTLLTVTLNLLNGFLIFSVAGLSIWLWQQGAVQTGAIAFSIGLVLRMQGMSQWILWEVSGVFENIGVVQDGIETIARERSVVDKPDARDLVVRHGEIHYDDIRFNYGLK
ncbi:MAG: ABC transporter ATP-binding protein/permease, partial [Fimbriimonadaceae bacterium]|nr:ABC transporter ATP-binding protein/permease [Alphaproteobacteria bacterium]